MAKKSFNISSTLNKNKAQKEPVPELAKKIPLPKKDKDVEALKEKIDSLHEEEVAKNATTTSKPAASSTKPVKTRKKAKSKQEEENEKLVRLTIDTPEVMHKRLKIKSIEKGVSMRDYILRLIEKDLGK